MSAVRDLEYPPESTEAGNQAVGPAITSTTVTSIRVWLAVCIEMMEAGLILAVDDARAPQSNAAGTTIAEAAEESVAPVTFAIRVVGQVLRVQVRTHLRSRAWLVLDVLLHCIKGWSALGG